MLYETEGDLVQDERYNMICHQTNCMGVMDSGIAKQIALKYPEVKYRNFEYCRTSKNPLGTILPVRIGPQRVCVNLYGQWDYGRERKVYTDYNMLQKAFNEFARRLDRSSIPSDWTIGFPFRMSCGLGGGDWQAVRRMIEKFSEDVSQDVYIVHKIKKWWDQI